MGDPRYMPHSHQEHSKNMEAETESSMENPEASAALPVIEDGAW
jgi:hypothetical protein